MPILGLAGPLKRTSIMEVAIRTIRPGEEHGLLLLLADAYGNYLDPTESRHIMSSQRFDPAGCFIAEGSGSPMACVAVTRLPRDRWFVIRYLAAREAKSRVEIVRKLLEKAVQHARSQSPEYVRATTPAVEPYVTAYEHANFSRLRRDFRIVWDLDAHHHGQSDLKIGELRVETLGEAAESYADSLRPFWDWRTEEQGGHSALVSSFKERVRHGERWLACHVNGRMVGFTGLLPDFYGTGKARFRGASVLPEYRGKGIGSALMHEIMSFAKTLGQDRMVVYTFSYLDRLAPGASLYLRSGGRIEAEYLQFQM